MRSTTTHRPEDALTAPSTFCTGLRAIGLVVLFSAVPRPALAQKPGPATVEQLSAKATAALPSLALRPAEYEARLAASLVAMRDGELEAARGALSALASEVEEGHELAARVQLEHERAQAWGAMLEAYFADVVASGSKITVEYEGKKLKTPVRALEAGVLKLGQNRRGLSELPLTMLTPVKLSDTLRQKVAKHGPEWLRIYPYALAGDERAHSLLRRDESEAVLALKRDAREFYPELMKLGEAALALDRMAAAAAPNGAESARAAKDTISALHAVAGADDLYTSRAESLAAVMRLSLTLLFQEDGLATLLVGKLESLEKGRVRLTYDFESDEQLADFVRDDSFLAPSRRSRPPVNLPEGLHDVWIDQGALICLGRVAARHKLELSGATRVRYRLVYEQHEAHPTPITNFAFGLCGDLDGSFVWCLDQGHLYVANQRPKFGSMNEITPRPIVQLQQAYELEVQHDGKQKIVASSQGTKLTEVECGPRKSGFPFVWAHSMAEARLTDLTIEGSVSESSLNRLRSGWIVERFDALELEDDESLAWEAEQEE